MIWILNTVLQPAGPIGPNGFCKVSVSGETIAVAWPTALDVYTFSQGGWSPQRVSSGGDFRAVALEGDTLALGLAGQVKVFSRTNGVWGATQTLLPPTPAQSSLFGTALALRGNTLVVGDQSVNDNVGQVVVFDRIGGVWSAEPVIIGSIPDQEECFVDPADQHFGAAVAFTSLVVAGQQIDRLVVGKPGAGQTCAKFMAGHPGHAYAFERIDLGSWTLKATLASQQPQPGGRFGSRVVADGNTIVVSGNGEISGFQNLDGAWTRTFEQASADLELPLGLDGATLAFGSGGNLDPFASVGDGSFTEEPPLALSPDAELADVSVDGPLLAAAEGTTETVSVFRLGLPRPTRFWATINPLVLLLGDQTFVRLTLPDPPPPDVWRAQIVAGIEAMTVRQRRAASRAIGASISLLTDVQRLLATGKASSID